MENKEEIQVEENNTDVFEDREEAMATSAAEIRAYAREALRGKWGYGVSLLLLALLLYLAPTIPGRYIEENTIPSHIWSIISAIYSWGLWIGYLACFVDIARKLPKKYTRLFTGFRSIKYLLKIALTCFLQGLFIVLWSLLLIVPGIIKIFSYAMTDFILIDHPEYGPLQAITESRKMMDGNRMRLFILGLSFIGWDLLCLVTFGIAALWVFPYLQAARAKFYLDVKATYEQKLAATPIQEAESVPAEPVEEEKSFEVEE